MYWSWRKSSGYFKSMFHYIIALFFVVQQIGESLNWQTLPERLFHYNQLLYPNSARRNDYSERPPETVYVVVYYESLCSDSRDFFTSQLVSAYELLEQYLDVRIIPYGKATTKLVDGPEYYTFECQHGPSECYGNKLHACALDVFPSGKTAHLFNICIMDFDHNAKGSDDTAVDKCGRALSFNINSIKDCAKNTMGTFLHNYYGQRTKMATFDYVPHVLINGVRSNGTSLISEICATLSKPPTECKIFQ